MRGSHTTTHARIADDRSARETCPTLADAIERITDPQVRNRATIGGSLCRNDPAADLPAVALALDAMIRIVGSAGPRTVPAVEFLVGPFEILAKRGDVVTEVLFPGTAGSVGSAYEKFKNPATGLALCGIAALLRRAPGGAIEKCRVAATGVADCAVRLRGVEEALEGTKPTADSLAAAAERSGEGVRFVSDHFASNEYRAHLCTVLTKRALARALNRTSGA